MKKAKIMLTIVGLLAVVGGVLAFKVHRVGGKYFCSTIPTCTICAIAATTAGTLTTSLYCTTNPFNCCIKLVTVARRL